MRAFGKQFLDAEFTGCDELIESGLGQRFERWPIWFYTVRERVALNAFSPTQLSVYLPWTGRRRD